MKDYDEMIAYERSVAGALGELGEVDGHDAGTGEMNIFILTDRPKLAFDRIKEISDTEKYRNELKAAFREIGKDEFVIIFPENLVHFSIS